MKFLKGLLIFLLIVFVGYCIFMFFLPKSYTLERKITIEASPAKVYNVVLDLKSWKNWSYWDNIDSTNVVTYSGPEGQVGASYAWKGDPAIVGEGSFTVTELKENERIDFDLAFMGQDPAKGYFTFEPIGEGETEVTYAFVAEFGFFDRISKFILPAVLGEPYEKSLAELKEYVENMPDKPTAADYEVEIVTVEAMPYYSVTDEVAMSDMDSEFMAQRYGEISAYLGEDMQNATAPPFSIYPLWDEENQKAIIEVGMAVQSEKPGNERVKKGETYAGEAMKVNFYGPYEGLGAAHEAIYAYAQANNIEMGGYPYEVYVTDPSTESDQSKWLTEVYYPVKSEEAEM